MGVDATNSTRRSPKLVKARLAKMAKHAANLRRLSGSGRGGKAVARFVAPGHNAVGSWGLRATGATDGEIFGMRASAASVATKLAPGQSAVQALTAAGFGALDPALVANAGPVEEWAIAVWEGFPSLTLLNLALKDAQARAEASRFSWSIASDGAAALVLTLARLGWRAMSARHLIPHDGRHLDLLRLAPKCVAGLVKEAARTWSEFGAIGGRRGARIFWQAFKPLLNGRARSAWSTHHCNAAVKILSNGAWPGVTRPRSGAEDEKCALCGAGWSVSHGVYECSAIEHHRRTAASPELRAAAAAAKAADCARGEMVARGFLPHPGPFCRPQRRRRVSAGSTGRPVASSPGLSSPMGPPAAWRWARQGPYGRWCGATPRGNSSVPRSVRCPSR